MTGNEPAFPRPAFHTNDGQYFRPVDGISTRLWVATHILQGVASRKDITIDDTIDASQRANQLIRSCE
jgi:hypothetical protein